MSNRFKLFGFAALIAFIGFFTPIGKFVKNKVDYIEHIQKPIAKSSMIDSFDRDIQYLLVYNPDNHKYQGRNEKVVPESLASLVKVLIAFATVKELEKGNLSPSEKLDFEDWDAGGHDAVGNTVEEAMFHMLNSSSNSATNVLIEKLGGFDSINAILRKNRFKSTFILCELGPAQQDELKCEGKNESTLLEMTKAFEYLVSDKGKFNYLAQKPMEKTIFPYSHTNRLMNKTGINSKVIGNIALVEIDGQKYIISAIFADPPQADRFDNLTENDKIRENTDPKSKTDPISRVTQEVINALNDVKL